MKREELQAKVQMPKQLRNYNINIVVEQKLDAATGDMKREFIHKTRATSLEGTTIEEQYYITLQLKEKLVNPKKFTIGNRPVTLNIFERDGQFFDWLIQNLCEGGNIAKPLPIEEFATPNGIIEKDDKVLVTTNLDIDGYVFTVPCEPFYMTAPEESGSVRKMIRVKQLKYDVSGTITVQDAVVDSYKLFVSEGTMDDAIELLWKEYNRRVKNNLVTPLSEDEIVKTIIEEKQPEVAE